MIEYGKLPYRELEDYSNMQAAQIRKKNNKIEQLQARVKELEALTHKQRDLESQLQGEINHLEAENAELRAELFCNQMCVRFWPSHHSNCRLLAIRLNRIKQQADDEGKRD